MDRLHPDRSDLFWGGGGEEVEGQEGGLWTVLALSSARGAPLVIVKNVKSWLLSYSGIVLTK